MIPAAHDMPSAAAVVNDERLRFVLTARPDLTEPLRAALGAGPADAGARLDMLARDNPQTLGGAQLVIVAGYYTDKTVRELIGYPGQMALSLRTWALPEYLEEGLSTPCSPAARCGATPRPGSERPGGRPTDVRRRFAARPAPPEGGHDGRHRA